MLEGLPPHAPTHVMRLSTDERSAKALTEILGEIFDPAETAVAAFECDDGRSWLLEAYFASEPDPDMLRDLVRPAVGDAIEAATFASLAGRDWVKRSLDGLKPVRVWRFLVHGAHDRAAIRANDLAIEIEAALAFGTGHHATTSGCLAALAHEVRRRRPRRVLDVGTGTGILAIAAARSARGRPVTAGDIDPVAVAVARSNARLNGVGPGTRFYVAPGLRHALARGRFDLVTANILARALARLAPALSRALAPEGRLVLSGLLDRDVAGIVSAYRAQGLALLRRRSREGWATLVLARGGAAGRPRRRPRR